jgi:hypothetical protein
MTYYWSSCCPLKRRGVFLTVRIWFGEKAMHMAQLLLIQLLLHFAWLFETIVSVAEEKAVVLTKLPQEPRLYLPNLTKLLPPKLPECAAT